MKSIILIVTLACTIKGIKGQFGFIQKRQSIEEPEIRDEFKSDLRTILDEYLEKFGTTYDPEKVELFLTNMADEVFDNQGVVSLDHIRYLIETGYFQPEMREEDDIKPIDSDSSDYISKRFLASLARTNNMPSWFDDQSTVNKRYISSLLRQGKLPFVFQPTTASPRGDQWIQNMQKPKRSNSESFQSAEEFVPVMQGSKTLQTLIDDFLMREQNMQKRYLGALARSGWMPRRFTTSFHPNSIYNKRHLAALAKLGWYRNTPSFYVRNGRGSFDCSRNDEITDRNIQNIRGSDEETRINSSPTAAETQANGIKTKKFLLLPAVDNILLRRQYPHLATNI
ncbi:uncharacterized protein LOC126893975 isoform X2 [Daktulosphaira vitifoliae]|uniref:uncharacterized protein LOC126893975 isoform X2 n=1 Tax=Daktulosphaira vitifoliae TaxID=58002 RepID=UPI0021AA0DEC|nr:uncharacterized protein LOC126893975 isoform X2 [Daktulosphaira vitifoliae]